MPQDLLLDDDGDLRHVNRFATPDELVAQRIRIRLGLIVGQWLQDASIGIPWLDWLVQKPVKIAENVMILRAAIESTPGVDHVESLTGTFNQNTRVASYTGVAILTTGARAAVRLEPGAQPFNVDPWVGFL